MMFRSTIASTVGLSALLLCHFGSQYQTEAAVCTGPLQSTAVRGVGEPCGGYCLSLGQCKEGLSCDLGQFHTGVALLGRAAEGVCRDPEVDAKVFCESECSKKLDEGEILSYSRLLSLSNDYQEVHAIISNPTFLERMTSIIGPQRFSRVVCAQEVILKEGEREGEKSYRLMIDDSALDYRAAEDVYQRVIVTVKGEEGEVQSIKAKQLLGKELDKCR